MANKYSVPPYTVKEARLHASLQLKRYRRTKELIKTFFQLCPMECFFYSIDIVFLKLFFANLQRPYLLPACMTKYRLKHSVTSALSGLDERTHPVLSGSIILLFCLQGSAIPVLQIQKGVDNFLFIFYSVR